MSLLNGGVQLSLYVGPVPIAAPRELIEALVHVKVEHHSGGVQSGFELTFELPARSPLCTLFLVTGGGAIPLIRVVLAVTINGRSESIIDGVTTNVEMQPGQGGVARVLVQGKDMSALMNIIELPGIPYPAMPPSVRVLVCLAKYAAFGVIPIVIPSILDIPPLPIDEIPQQRGSDYAFVTGLADEAGYVFYLEPGPTPGTSKAYWGPEIRVGEPQPALTMNTGALDNVQELSFSFDKEHKKMPIVFFQESMSKAPIPVLIPDITPLNPPLGIVPPLPPKTEQLERTAHLSAPEALMAGLAYASQNSDSVTGRGSLDVAKYGRLLKSRQLVGVRGAGLAYDGLHYVKSVTHEIERGSYKQNFTLARNGLISTVPRVPV
jgi:hypothetical protein